MVDGDEGDVLQTSAEIHASAMKRGLPWFLTLLATGCLAGCQVVDRPPHSAERPALAPARSQPDLAVTQQSAPVVPVPVVPTSFSEEVPAPLPTVESSGGGERTFTGWTIWSSWRFIQNPALARAAARIEALRGRWVQVGLPANPRIGYMAEEMGAEGTAGMQGGFLSQEYILQCKRDLSRAQVSQEIARAEQSWWVERQRVLTDVHIAYYDVLVAQKRLQVAQELVQISDSAVTASKALLRAAEISAIALLQAEIEAEQTRITLRRAENESRLAWQQLAIVIGAPQTAARARRRGSRRGDPGRHLG
jgi:outer membrane protein, heavy metal efflux system